MISAMISERAITLEAKIESKINGIFFSHKKEGNPAIWKFSISQVNLEGIMLNKINQTQKDKYCMESLIYGIKKEKKVNVSNINQNGDCKWLKSQGNGGTLVKGTVFQLSDE